MQVLATPWRGKEVRAHGTRVYTCTRFKKLHEKKFFSLNTLYIGYFLSRNKGFLGIFRVNEFNEVVQKSLHVIFKNPCHGNFRSRVLEPRCGMELLTCTSHDMRSKS